MAWKKKHGTHRITENGKTYVIRRSELSGKYEIRVLGENSIITTRVELQSAKNVVLRLISGRKVAGTSE